jgi:transcriptional regulator with XRE-family HTH domain
MVSCMEINAAAKVRTPYQLGQVLAARRASLGLDQSQVADQLHTHRPSVSNIENGKATIQTELLFAMLDALDLEIAVLEKQRQ